MRTKEVFETRLKDGRTFMLPLVLKGLVEKLDRSGIHLLEIIAGDTKNFEKGHIMLDWNASPAIVNRAVSIVLQSGINIPVISWELKYHLGESRKEIINE